MRTSVGRQIGFGAVNMLQRQVFKFGVERTQCGNGFLSVGTIGRIVRLSMGIVGWSLPRVLGVARLVVSRPPEGVQGRIAVEAPEEFVHHRETAGNYTKPGFYLAPEDERAHLVETIGGPRVGGIFKLGWDSKDGCQAGDAAHGQDRPCRQFETPLHIETVDDEHGYGSKRNVHEDVDAHHEPIEGRDGRAGVSASSIAVTAYQEGREPDCSCYDHREDHEPDCLGGLSLAGPFVDAKQSTANAGFGKTHG